MRPIWYRRLAVLLCGGVLLSSCANNTSPSTPLPSSTSSSMPTSMPSSMPSNMPSSMPTSTPSSVPSSTPPPAEHAPVLQVDSTTLLPNFDTRYHVFTPGILNPEAGTIEITVRINHDYQEFSNNWESMFSCIPTVDGIGKSMLNAFIPPPETSTENGTYDQPLNFHILNGAPKKGKSSVGASWQDIEYTPGKEFNLAFMWQLGPNGYIAIYNNGQQVGRADTEIAPLMQTFVGSLLSFARTAPFYISNVKVSTAALPQEALETSTDTFTPAKDTALLADITHGQAVKETFYYQTPYHKAGPLQSVRPVLMMDTQVYTAGEAVYTPFLLLNCGPDDQDYQIRLTGTNAYGETAFTTQQTLRALATGDYQGARLPVPITAAGYYDMTIEVKGPSGTDTYTGGLALVPAPDDTLDGSFAGRYGQHTPGAYSLAAFEKLNTSIVRTYDGTHLFTWYNIEPEDNLFEWDRPDDFVRRADAYGIDILAVLGAPSNWASTRPAIPIEDAASNFQHRSGRHPSIDIKTNENGELGNGALWRDYVYRVMKRYVGRVKYYEVINEVNFNTEIFPSSFSGTTAEYLLMQKITYEEAQRVKAEYLAEHGEEVELYISTSGFSPWIGSTKIDSTLVLDTLALADKGYYDIFNIHGYGSTEQLTPLLFSGKQINASDPNMEDIRKMYPNLQFWQGEYYPIHPEGETGETTLSWRVFATVQNCVDFLAAGADMYINMGVATSAGFVNQFTQSPTEVFQTMGVAQQQLRKVETFDAVYSTLDMLPTKHRFKRTDGNYLSIFASESAGELLLENPEMILSAEDAYGIPVSIKGNALQKLNNLFVVSTAPLEITRYSPIQ